MLNTSAKKLAQEVLDDLPEDATIEDVHYGLYVAELVQRRSESLDNAMKNGVEQGIAAGDLVPHDQVVQRMAKWLRK